MKIFNLMDKILDGNFVSIIVVTWNKSKSNKNNERIM